MEIIDISEYKAKLNQYEEKINELQKTLNIKDKITELEKLEEETLKENFWNDEKNSSKILAKIKQNKSIIDDYNRLKKLHSDCESLVMILEEEQDQEFKSELVKMIKELEDSLDKTQTEAFLSEQYDQNTAIVTIHPGAGGTESQDWALMLYRMYTRWAERTEHTVEIYDIQDGDEAGLKSITFAIRGAFPYGYLKSEKGVHRLVRISPFDSNSRRHTSFAAVDVMPEINEDINLEIKDEDLEIGTYRASGAGGQHVNKTSSAVRIKHIPTGVVVTCQTERSQFQNKDYAMKMLKSKLYQLELEKNQTKLNEIKGEVSDNSWGNQIRSYVFCPYTLVKDHRTGFEVGNVQKVMDGYIDSFITEYLKSIKK